jgi:radical SAM superfamily enzyme YgiQ (UPF0313 family)
VICLNPNLVDVPLEDLITDAIQKHDIDVICTGGVSAQYARVKEVLDIARTVKPDILTIVGGGLVSSEPELMADMLGFTYGVVGEGEETIIELAEALEKGSKSHSISGLVFRDQYGKTVLTPPRKPVQDLDSLPYPDYASFGLARFLETRLVNDERHLYVFDQPREISIISSRSCPYNCTFCYHPLGRVYRQRNMDCVVEEMKHWIEEYQINVFFILDELFSLKRERVLSFCEQVKPLNVKWIVSMRVTDVDAALLDSMRAAGCCLISYGLESGSDTVLQSMKKHITLEQILHCLDLTYNAQIGVQGNFIFGDKAETIETAAETFIQWLNLRKHNIWLAPIELYPGTELYKNACEVGIIEDRRHFISTGCPITNVSGMSESDYTRVMLVMELLRQLYQPIPAQVLRCSPGGLHPERGPVYSVEVRCPHCGSDVVYQNMAINGFPKIGCRQCNQRFDLPPLSSFDKWPSNYVIADEFEFSDAHVEELRKILDFSQRDSWLLSEGIQIGGLDTSFSHIQFLGHYYLIPQFISQDQILHHQLPILLTDERCNTIGSIYVPNTQLIGQTENGFNIVTYGSMFYALAQTLGEFELSISDDITLEELQAKGLCFISDTLEDVVSMADASGYVVRPKLIVSNYKGFNIVSFGYEFFGLAQSLGPIELTQVSTIDLQDYCRRGLCFIGNSIANIRNLVDQRDARTSLS